jgi:hypothetical protein
MAVTKDRVRFAAETAGPYVGRALRDEEFRQNLRAAFAAARSIYEELGSQRGLGALASRAASDEDVHANLRRAIAEVRQAADRLQRQERAKEKSHTFRNMAILLAGVAIGLFFNPVTGPETRRWVKGRVSGGPSSNGDRPAPPPTAEDLGS